MIRSQDYISVTGSFGLYTMVHLVRTWCVSFVRLSLFYVEEKILRTTGNGVRKIQDLFATTLFCDEQKWIFGGRRFHDMKFLKFPGQNSRE